MTFSLLHVARASTVSHSIFGRDAQADRLDSRAAELRREAELLSEEARRLPPWRTPRTSPPRFGTVANHIAQVLDRLGLDNRVQIATWGFEHNLGPTQAAGSPF